MSFFSMFSEMNVNSENKTANHRDSKWDIIKNWQPASRAGNFLQCNQFFASDNDTMFELCTKKCTLKIKFVVS